MNCTSLPGQSVPLPACFCSYISGCVDDMGCWRWCGWGWGGDDDDEQNNIKTHKTVYSTTMQCNASVPFLLLWLLLAPYAYHSRSFIRIRFPASQPSWLQHVVSPPSSSLVLGLYNNKRLTHSVSHFRIHSVFLSGWLSVLHRCYDPFASSSGQFGTEATFSPRSLLVARIEHYSKAFDLVFDWVCNAFRFLLLLFLHITFHFRGIRILVVGFQRKEI